MFTAEQETHIVNMVIANNSIRLREIQQRIIEDDTTFQNIHNVSISVLQFFPIANTQFFKLVWFYQNI